MKLGKAPASMIAPEFVEFLKPRFNPDSPAMSMAMSIITEALNEPAPNPFTEDQLAWMWIEYVYRNVRYAVMSLGGDVLFFRDKPTKASDGTWQSNTACTNAILGKYTFLGQILSHDDQEPLCLADYVNRRSNHVQED